MPISAVARRTLLLLATSAHQDWGASARTSGTGRYGTKQSVPDILDILHVPSNTADNDFNNASHTLASCSG